MVSSFKQLTINMKSLLDMQLGVGIKTVEDWILNLGAEVYKAQYDLDSLAQIRDNNLGLLKILMNTTDPPEFNAQYGLLLILFSIFNDPGFFFTVTRSLYLLFPFRKSTIWRGEGSNLIEICRQTVRC